MLEVMKKKIKVRSIIPTSKGFLIEAGRKATSETLSIYNQILMHPLEWARFEWELQYRRGFGEREVEGTPGGRNISAM